MKKLIVISFLVALPLLGATGKQVGQEQSEPAKQLEVGKIREAIKEKIQEKLGEKTGTQEQKQVGQTGQTGQN